MSIWTWLFGHTHSAFDENAHSTTASHDTGTVNPATGLPMTSGDTTGFDFGGSPFGCDVHSDTPSSTGGSEPW